MPTNYYHAHFVVVDPTSSSTSTFCSATDWKDGKLVGLCPALECPFEVNAILSYLHFAQRPGSGAVCRRQWASSPDASCLWTWTRLCRSRRRSDSRKPSLTMEEPCLSSSPRRWGPLSLPLPSLVWFCKTLDKAMRNWDTELNLIQEICPAYICMYMPIYVPLCHSPLSWYCSCGGKRGNPWWYKKPQCH